MPHKRSKKLESLVKAARLYAGSMSTTSMSTQQKLYNRFKKLAQSIADKEKMFLGDVMDQASSMARTLGPITPSPGKDY